MSCTPTKRIFTPSRCRLASLLDPALEFLRGLDAQVSKDRVQIHARQVSHHVARGEVLEQVALAGVLVGPIQHVGDLKLHRQAHVNQTHRAHLGDFSGIPGHAGGGGSQVVCDGRRFHVADEKIDLFDAGVRDAPQNRLGHLALRVGSESDVKRLDLAGAVAINVVNRPRPDQMPAGIQDRTRRVGHIHVSEAFQHALLARFDENQARGQQQHRQLRQEQHRQAFPQQLEEPRFRNLEAELIIQRLRRRGEQAFRLRQQPDEPAVVKRARHLALHARPVNFQQQRDEHFRRHQPQQHAPRPRDNRSRSWETPPPRRRCRAR